jgi:Holliday junction DNA helicase RuvA
MIASLRGFLQSSGADHAVIDVGGVGYLVQVSARTATALREPRDLTRLPNDIANQVFVHIETQVREDAITLYGFLTEAERDWFRRLTGVQGVGGKVALSILGTLAPDELGRVITLEDRAMIARANGVGPRLAARIVTELKGKELPGLGTVLAPAPGAPKPAASAAADAVSALANLGFREPEALRAVAEAQRDLGSDLPTPTLIREALKRASR